MPLVFKFIHPLYTKMSVNINFISGFKCISNLPTNHAYLGADLVAALAGLHVDDLAHVVVGGVCVGVAREGRGELRRCRRPDGERCSRGITD